MAVSSTKALIGCIGGVVLGAAAATTYFVLSPESCIIAPSTITAPSTTNSNANLHPGNRIHTVGNLGVGCLGKSEFAIYLRQVREGHSPRGIPASGCIMWGPTFDEEKKGQRQPSILFIVDDTDGDLVLAHVPGEAESYWTSLSYFLR